MADDIVTRLRNQCYCGPIEPTDDPCDICDAADEIERLQAVNVELRAEIQRLEQVTRG